MKTPYLTVGILFAISISIYVFVLNKGDLSGGKPVTEEPEHFGAEVRHESGWAVIPREKEGDREYWFVAPDENGVSPGVFKKIVHDGDDGKEFTIVSDCEAPKVVCDRLMSEFEALQGKYN